MALPSGTQLGPYEILAPLGAGGMGEVYRARDSRLGREVAVKVLPEVFAQDPERMARFEREAQILASLNHPHVAQLYGLKQHALVMEYVPGENLKGPLPLDEALPIARQVAEALEYAHDRGIVHRDLKPANIKLTPEGQVKVLDFGLAKALDDDPATSNLQHSPTLSLAATRAGVILGTAAYMSPEQAKGKPVDRRADIWAFGVVLYEVLAGRPMYTGETAPETLAAVMMKDPTLDALPASTPPTIRQLLGRCLEKDPRRRLRDIGEARLVIEDLLAGGPLPTAAPAPATAAPAPPQPAASRRPWVVATVLFAASTLATAVLHFRETPPVERTVRFSIPAPEKTSIHTFAVSPDGRTLAIAAGAGGKRQLWLRPLDALQAQPLPGTEEAGYPFWSPDSRYIGFFAQGKLRKIAASGGPAQTLCDAPDGRGGTWNRDGVIVFAPSGRTGSVLQRVAAAGGVPAPATQATGTALHRFPVFLPGGSHYLYLQAGAGDQGGVYWASLDSKAGRRVLSDISSAVYVPPAAKSQNGRLLFVRENTLVAQPFDAKTLQPTGDLFPVAEQVSFGGVLNYVPVSVSTNGVLVYQAGRRLGENQLTWYDRSGKPLGKVGAPGMFVDFALSPDEKTTAESRFVAGSTSDLWLHELAGAPPRALPSMLPRTRPRFGHRTAGVWPSAPTAAEPQTCM